MTLPPAVIERAFRLAGIAARGGLLLLAAGLLLYMAGLGRFERVS